MNEKSKGNDGTSDVHDGSRVLSDNHKHFIKRANKKVKTSRQTILDHKI